MTPPFRVEHVGSFLRPAYLLEAARQAKAGALAPDEYRQVQDRAITEIVRWQEAAGLRSVSLWSAVPHYVSLAPSPRAAKALCTRLADLLGTPIDMTELDQAESEYSSQVSEAVASDPDTQAYVEELEQRADTIESFAEGGELPSGESLAAELTRFLRERERGRKDDPPDDKG